MAAPETEAEKMHAFQKLPSTWAAARAWDACRGSAQTQPFQDETRYSNLLSAVAHRLRSLASENRGHATAGRLDQINHGKLCKPRSRVHKKTVVVVVRATKRLGPRLPRCAPCMTHAHPMTIGRGNPSGMAVHSCPMTRPTPHNSPQCAQSACVVFSVEVPGLDTESQPLPSSVMLVQSGSEDVKG